MPNNTSYEAALEAAAKVAESHSAFLESEQDIAA
jgi:hypothetical protein